MKFARVTPTLRVGGHFSARVSANGISHQRGMSIDGVPARYLGKSSDVAWLQRQSNLSSGARWMRYPRTVWHSLRGEERL